MVVVGRDNCKSKGAMNAPSNAPHATLKTLEQHLWSSSGALLLRALQNHCCTVSECTGLC